jgi:hypothetical protein
MLPFPESAFLCEQRCYLTTLVLSDTGCFTACVPVMIGKSPLPSQTIAAFPALAEMLPSEEEGTEGGTVPGAGADVHDVDDIETLANDFFQV